MSVGPRVAVIGGGITGLAGAYFLTREASGKRPEVILLEAGERLGGNLRTEVIAGMPIDVGAEALFAGLPWAIELCRELGLGDELVGSLEANTCVWTRGRLRPLPVGILSGFPDGIGPVLRSGIVSPAGVARAALDLVLPAAHVDGDRSVGELIRRRLGRETLQRLVDPLLGTIYAGDSDQLSLRATAPVLDAMSRKRASLIRSLLAAKPPTREGPMFMTLTGGLERLAARLSEEIAEVEVRSSTRVESLTRVGEGGYRVALASGEPLNVDGVLVAVPADGAAVMLRPLSPQAADELAGIEYASVIIVSLVFGGSALASPPSVSGFLVPHVDGRLVGACTFSSLKWPHLADDTQLRLRCAIGRGSETAASSMDDDTLVALVSEELREALGLRGTPTAARVTRWPAAMPQYAPGHLDRVGLIEAELAKLGGVELAGAALRGIGVAQCVNGARGAAGRLLAELRGGARSARRG
ncbi:MAG: protoporphyrinogen oxidase [Solirubrobacteraceae bacterium]|jgi:oxygen-dependent protoporphyrinogen oxidase